MLKFKTNINYGGCGFKPLFIVDKSGIKYRLPVVFILMNDLVKISCIHTAGLGKRIIIFRPNCQQFLIKTLVS